MSTESDGADLGRWTITNSALRGVSQVIGPVTNGPVPVVPCDDAAVERATMALSHYFPSRSHELVRVAVEAVLRAAGETP